MRREYSLNGKQLFNSLVTDCFSGLLAQSMSYALCMYHVFVEPQVWEHTNHLGGAQTTSRGWSRGHTLLGNFGFLRL